MTGVSVGHSASCVMCLVDTMWVPLVVSLSSLFKKAFSYTRGAGFAQVRGELGPIAWLGLQVVPPQRCESTVRSALDYVSLHGFFLVADASKTDVRCSGLLRTFSSSTRPASSNVTFVHAIESIGDAWLPQSSSCVLLQNDAMWPGLSGCARDGASCDYGPHAGLSHRRAVEGIE